MSGTATYTILGNKLALGSSNAIQGTSFETLRGTKMNVSADPNNPVIPQFVNFIQVAFDQVIYFTADGKGFMQGDADSPYLKIVIGSLPVGVTGFKKGVLYTGQSASGQPLDYLVILTNNFEAYYCMSAVGSFLFGSWNKIVFAPGSAMMRVPVITNLVLLEGIAAAFCGRFVDASGKYYGMCAVNVADINTWDVYPNSQFGKNGNKSYVRNISTDSNGDVWMYGKIFDDTGLNLLAVNISGSPADYTFSGTYVPLNAVEEMFDLVHLSNGSKIGMVVPVNGQYGSKSLGCGAAPGPVGATKVLVFWDNTNMNWFRLSDAADAFSKKTLSSLGIVSCNVASDFKTTGFVIASECSYMDAVPSNINLFVVFITPATSPTNVKVRIVPLKIPPTVSSSTTEQFVTMDTIAPVTTVAVSDMPTRYPIIVTGVEPQKKATGGSIKKDKQTVEWFKNPWIIAAIVTVGLGILVWVYVKIITGMRAQAAKEQQISQTIQSLMAKSSQSNAAQSPAAQAVPPTAPAAFAFGKPMYGFSRFTKL